ncbi:MAG: hypothetical protein H6R26_1680 [Proteobacteria bacterium]|nr:hypothetical protein [Pseudomonadota bacterium]
MDLKVYYQKLRQIESGLTNPSVVLISLATPDGGRAGVATEAPRDVAAKMIVDGSARAATETEAQEYREKCQEACRAAEQASLASRIQVMVLSEPEVKKLAGGSKGTKGQ